MRINISNRFYSIRSRVSNSKRNGYLWESHSYFERPRRWKCYI